MQSPALELPVTLRVSRSKIALLFLMSAAFAAGSVWIVFFHGAEGYTVDGMPITWVGWGGIVVFGFCTLALPLQFLPNAAYLRLTTEGFTYSSAFRAHTVRWEDVQEFGIMVMHHNRMIGWNYVPGYDRSRAIRGFNKAVTGYDAGLPNTYGLGVDQLVQALEMLRRQHAGNAAG